MKLGVSLPMVVLTSVILIASNCGGSRHPAWYHNLRAHPECELSIGPRGGRFIDVKPMEQTEIGCTDLPRIDLPGYSRCTRSAAVTEPSR